MEKQTIKIQGNEYTIVKNLSMKYFDRDFSDNFQEYKYICKFNGKKYLVIKREHMFCEDGIYNNVDYVDYEVAKL